MIWKKRIPGFVVTVLFAIVGLVCTGMHFYASFAALSGAIRVILSLIATIVSAGLTVLLAFLLRMLSKSIRKSLAEELTDQVKWKNILWIAGAAVAVLGLIFRIILALTATDVSENALFHAALTGEYTDDSTGGVRVRLYIAILGALIKIAGGSVKGALVMQALLYVIAAVLVFCGVRFLGGRGGAVLGEAVMLFLPLFPSARIVQDDVIFWLMLGAGLFVGALYVRYATDTDPEETFLMKILISIFTGLLVGIIFGWDAGLMVLFIVAVYAFFAEDVKPLSILPLFAVFLVSSVGGYFVSVASPAAWTRYYFSELKTVLPHARDQHVIWIAIMSALSLTAVSAFFVRKKRENVTLWMVIALFAILFAGQMPLSGVFAPAFLCLVLAVLFGSSVSSLLVRAAMDVPAGKAADAKARAKHGGKHHAKKEEQPAAVPAKHGADTATEDDAEVDKLLEHVWVEQIVAEAMGEDTSEEKAAIQAALLDADESEAPAVPEPAAEMPAVPSGMVLPQGDGAVDADTTPRIPETFPGTPTGAPIGLQREPEQPAAPAAPVLSAEAVGLGSVADLARRMEEDSRRAEAEAAKLAQSLPAEAETEKTAPALSAEAVGLGGVADLARRMEEDRRRAEAEAEKLAQRLSAEQGGRSLEDEIRRREMEETARREEALKQKTESGVTAEEEARRRREEEEAARRREEAERRQREEEARRQREEEERRQREEDERRRAEEEAARRREEAERRQREEDERRRAEEEEAARRREEADRRQREEDERRRAEEEEAARRREEAERRQREEDERRQREEDERRRAEEEESARRREEEERRQREEDERRRAEEEESVRLADEAERRRREDEEIAERRRREDEELAARRREEDERRQREEDERRRAEEEEAARRREEDERRQREEDERRRAEEEEAARRREEDERRQREAERTTRTREERSPAARSVGRKPASEGFDFDITDGDDFDL